MVVGKEGNYGSAAINGSVCTTNAIIRQGGDKTAVKIMAVLPEKNRLPFHVTSARQLGRQKAHF